MDEIRDRLARLEERQLFAVATQKQMADDLEVIRKELDGLHDFIMGAKGAKYALFILAVGFGYAISWADSIFKMIKQN